MSSAFQPYMTSRPRTAGAGSSSSSATGDPRTGRKGGSRVLPERRRLMPAVSRCAARIAGRPAVRGSSPSRPAKTRPRFSESVRERAVMDRGGLWRIARCRSPRA
ncbi:hypothetical protein ADL35_10090 [Streptomyces sp. NRRL WC-3753]|nr:hypothetical protein ADL35_10090 [Streptomyces sp. NRRL WC-3753]